MIRLCATDDEARRVHRASGGWMIDAGVDGWWVTTDEGAAIDAALPLYRDDREAATQAVRASAEAGWVVYGPSRTGGAS